jgi:hypothetical protein
MKNEKLIKFFEENDFFVHLHEQDGVQCAELETWTEGGVNMIIWLNPFSEEEFEKYAYYFDIDEEIDLNRQDEAYRNDFTIRESVEDFLGFHNRLKDILSNLLVHQK